MKVPLIIDTHTSEFYVLYSQKQGGYYDNSASTGVDLWYKDPLFAKHYYNVEEALYTRNNYDDILCLKKPVGDLFRNLKVRKVTVKSKIWEVE